MLTASVLLDAHHPMRVDGVSRLRVSLIDISWVPEGAPRNRRDAPPEHPRLQQDRVAFVSVPADRRLAKARALLTVVELLWFARSSAALQGVQPAEAAARRLVPIGERLRAAVAVAEAAPPGLEREAALREVVRLGEFITTDRAWESIDGLLAVCLRSIRGDTDKRGAPPRGMA